MKYRTCIERHFFYWTVANSTGTYWSVLETTQKKSPKQQSKTKTKQAKSNKNPLKFVEHLKKTKGIKKSMRKTMRYHILILTPAWLLSWLTSEAVWRLLCSWDRIICVIKHGGNLGWIQVAYKHCLFLWDCRTIHDSMQPQDAAAVQHNTGRGSNTSPLSLSTNSDLCGSNAIL